MIENFNKRNMLCMYNILGDISLVRSHPGIGKIKSHVEATRVV